MYGLATLGLTGERGSYWLFALVAAAQTAWYFHRCGRIAVVVGSG